MFEEPPSPLPRGSRPMRSCLMFAVSAQAHAITTVEGIGNDPEAMSPVQQAFADMGVLAFADADVDAAMAEDEAAGDELDARMAHVKSVAAEA